MAIARRKPDPDGIITARLAGTAGRHVSWKPLDVEAAVAELREIANGRGDLLAAISAGVGSGPLLSDFFIDPASGEASNEVSPRDL